MEYFKYQHFVSSTVSIIKVFEKFGARVGYQRHEYSKFLRISIRVRDSLVPKFKDSMSPTIASCTTFI